MRPSLLAAWRERASENGALELRRSRESHVTSELSQRLDLLLPSDRAVHDRLRGDRPNLSRSGLPATPKREVRHVAARASFALKGYGTPMPPASAVRRRCVAVKGPPHDVDRYVVVLWSAHGRLRLAVETERLTHFDYRPPSPYRCPHDTRSAQVREAGEARWSSWLADFERRPTVERLHELIE